MRDIALKTVAVSALQPDPDFSQLQLLRDSSRAETAKLLRWLDQSGLALYLCSRLHDEAKSAVPPDFRQALEQRLAANERRMVDMLQEFDRLVRAFQSRSVRFCALKGFSLVPDFCPALSLRHQTDFDFLVAPESLEDAKRALLSCGYNEEENPDPGEFTFATPLRHIPSADDDIYALPRHREVDLRISLRQDDHGVSIEMSCDSLNRVQTKTIHGVSFPALPPDDMFCVQVTHAFKHLLGSWVRLSWLLEIGYFIDVHRHDQGLWDSIRSRAGSSPVIRNAFGLIIAVTNKVFPRPIPKSLDDWCLRRLPSRIETWVEQFGLKSALSDLDGAKLTLFVHREFITDPDFWNSYLKNRIFPVTGRSSIGRVTARGPGVRIKAAMSQWLHGMGRVAFHARELVSLPVEAIRWKRALRSTEKQRALLTTDSN
jgi:Uncharacterised nucleotidyltransferase